MNFQNVRLTPDQYALVSDFMRDYDAKANSTRLAYETDVSQFIHWLENEQGQPVRALTFARASKALADFAKALARGPLAEATRQRKAKVARYFLDSLGHAVPKPAPKARPEVTPAVPLWQAERLLGWPVLDSRQRMLVALVFAEGMAASDIAALDYDPARGELTAAFAFNDLGTFTYLVAYLASRGRLPGPLFHREGARLSRQWVWKEIRRYGDALGIPECTPAALRNSHILRLQARGFRAVDIAARLGLHPSSVARVIRKGKQCAGK